MKGFKFEFGGHQEDGLGGVFPLFTVIHNFKDHPVLIMKTTLSGKSLFEQGFEIPSYNELRNLKKGNLVEIKYAKSKNIPS